MTSVKPSYAGNYRAQVTNPVTSVLSDVATLTVTTPPSGSATIVNGNTVRLTFPVLPGRSYQVEYKDSLTDATWQPLGSPTVASGSTLTVDDNITTHAQRFYRLSILP